MYCDREQLGLYGLPPKALGRFTQEEQDRALQAASWTADGYLRTRYAMPIIRWGLDLTRCIAAIASYDLMVQKGFDPGLASDEQLRLRYQDALSWLRSVQNGVIDPGLVDSASESDTPGINYITAVW